MLSKAKSGVKLIDGQYCLDTRSVKDLPSTHDNVQIDDLGMTTETMAAVTQAILGFSKDINSDEESSPGEEAKPAAQKKCPIPQWIDFDAARNMRNTAMTGLLQFAGSEQVPVNVHVRLQFQGSEKEIYDWVNAIERNEHLKDKFQCDSPVTFKEPGTDKEICQTFLTFSFNRYDCKREFGWEQVDQGTVLTNACNMLALLTKHTNYTLPVIIEKQVRHADTYERVRRKQPDDQTILIPTIDPETGRKMTTYRRVDKDGNPVPFYLTVEAKKQFVVEMAVSPAENDPAAAKIVVPLISQRLLVPAIAQRGDGHPICLPKFEQEDMPWITDKWDIPKLLFSQRCESQAIATQIANGLEKKLLELAGIESGRSSYRG